MDKVADFLDRVTKISVDVQKKTGKKMTNFLPAMQSDSRIKEIAAEVEEFSKMYYIPGVDSYDDLI